MKIGMIGLGKMGGNMAERLRRAGHEVVGFDRDPNLTNVPDLAGLVAALADQPSKIVWSMVPAGAPTESTVTDLIALMALGDIIIDGGNSRYTDSQRRSALCAESGIGFIDAGTSGGVWGLTEGYCLMVGGTVDNVATMQPIFDALAPTDGFVHAGASGAGHYTKMVHNGIEYGLMQAYAEGWELLMAASADGLHLDVPGAFSAWRNGSVVRSWLLDLADRALVDDPSLHELKGYANDSGEGRWTVEEGIRLSVPTPVISASLYARFVSRQDDSPAMKMIAALRNQFGGHAVVHEADGGKSA